MPRKPRTPKLRRTFSGVSEEVLSFFWWGGTISNEWAKGKTFEEEWAFWQEHRGEILNWYIAKVRRLGWDPGRRPSFFWYELEPQHKRRRRGWHTWIGPMRADGGDRIIKEPKFESNYQYLKRLGLLEGWEIESGPPRR